MSSKASLNGERTLDISRERYLINASKSKFPVMKYLKLDWQLYLMVLPGILLTFLFRYIPMYGILYSFQDLSLSKGFFNSPWVGLKHFDNFIHSYKFWLLIGNTIKIGFASFIFSFPAPIILALLLNELRSKYFKKAVQTISYFPHFISTVVIVGMLVQITSPSEGIINYIIKSVGGQPVNFMIEGQWFLPMYVITGIWQDVGFGSIVYLAALTAIDPGIYEAAVIDGASRFKQVLHVTIPGISPTIIIFLILAVGNLFSVSFEKILLMQNSLIYDVTDVINTYVYRMGIKGGQYSMSTAVNLFQTVINAILLVGANQVSRKVSETSLW